MAELDMTKSTTATTSAESFSVDVKALEFNDGSKEVIVDFLNATQYQGYYKTIPELGSALDSLGIYVVGKGFAVEGKNNRIMLDRITGSGKETITKILLNHFVMSKVIGDSFLEIVRNEKGELVNLLPIGAERMRVIYDDKNRIKRYEVLQSNKERRKIARENIFHKINEKIGDEQRGQSVIPAVQWVIDAMNEAMHDGRLVFHRNVFPLQIIEYDGDNETERDRLMTQHANAIKDGLALVVPKGVITISTADVKIQDPIGWLNFLSSFYYQVVRIPRVIATSEGTTEAGGKLGYLTFEPIYTYEQQVYEEEIWNQLALRIKFKRPPSLGGTIQEDESKNTGQVGVQPNDVQATLNRE